MTERSLPSQPNSDKSSSAAERGQVSANKSDGISKMSGLSDMIRCLLQECPTRQAIYDTLMQACQNQLPVSIVRSDYRIESVQLSEIRHSEEIGNSAAKVFSEKFMAEISQQVRTSKSRQPEFKLIKKSDHQLMVAAAAVIDLSTNSVEGVLTVMLAEAPEQPELILSVLDGIVATASATLLNRSLTASAKNQRTSFRTETTQVVRGKLEQPVHKTSSAVPTQAPRTAKPVKTSTETTQAVTRPTLPENPPPSPDTGSATSISMVGGSAMAAAALKASTDDLRKSSAAAKAAAPASDQTTHSQVAAISKAARFNNLKEFGFTLVNTISNQFQCEQVAFSSEQNSKVKIHAISGMADFKASSPGVASIRQSMEECLDEKSPIAFPAIRAVQEQAAIPSRSIHQQWAVECNNSSVCSLPLFDQDAVVAVVSLRRAANRPFTHADITKLKSMLEAYGPAVRVVEKAGQPVGSRISSAVKSTASDSMKRGSWGRWAAFVCFLVAAAWFVFGTMTYQPLCRSKITAANLRHFSAPFDGQLTSVAVMPGQRVNKGDVLVEFDTTTLKLEMISLQRQIAASDVQVKQAVSEGELGQASMANSRLAVLETEIQAIQKQIAEATITAPADGVVVLSDLQQRIGQEFPQGEEILRFVADGDWLLEVEVPDNLVSVVAAEQKGEFAPASDPTNKHEFCIVNVDGAASVIEDRNVFLARANFVQQPEEMMTGMEGTSKLSTVKKPVWWVVFHGIIDWARINFWL